MKEVHLRYCEDGCEELDNLSPPEQEHLSVCRSQVILSSVNHVPAEHSTSLDGESTAPTAPMGTECLLLAHATAPIDACVSSADSSKRLSSAIVSLLSAA